MHRSCRFLAVAVLGALLLTGCRTVPSGASATGEKTAATASDRSKSGRAGDADLEARAEAHAHYAAGIIAELNHETDTALQEFYQAALHDPENESLVLEVSWRFLQSKQPEKALKILQSAVRRPGASGAIYARLGFIYSQLGRNEEAIAANQIAVKKLPRSLSGYRNLYLNYLQIKRPESALKILDEAAKQSKAGAGFYIGLAELFANYAQQFPSQRQVVRAKATAVLERAENLKPAGTQSQIRLADAFYLAGNTDKAAALYLGVLDQLAELPQARDLVRARLADIYLGNGDHKRAVEQLEALVHDNPSNAQAYYSLASIAYDEQRWADAADYLKKVLLFLPDFQQAYYDLASAQLALGQPDQAVTTLGHAKEKFPQNFMLEYLLAVTEVRQRNYAEAVKHFTAAEVIAKATDTNRLTHVFYFEVGAALERKGNGDEAESYLEKCLKLKPDFSEAQNYLGYMWAERGEKLDQARELIGKALKAQPKNPAYLDSMGWVLYKQKQPKEALDYILQAVKLNKEPDATLYEHLGDVYAALNETIKAREAWSKSLAVEKNDAVQNKLNASPSK